MIKFNITHFRFRQFVQQHKEDEEWTEIAEKPIGAVPEVSA